MTNPIENMDFTKAKFRKSKPHSCGNQFFNIKGKKIAVQDWIEANKDGTEIKAQIEQAGGIEQIKIQKGIYDPEQAIDFNRELHSDVQKIHNGTMAEQKAMLKIKKMNEQKQEIKQEPKDDKDGTEN